MTLAERDHLQPSQLEAIDALAERLREVRDAGALTGMNRLLLRRIQAIRSQLQRVSRLARDDSGIRYDAIARRRAMSAVVEIRTLVGLDAKTREILVSCAERIFSLSTPQI
ncbi:MAG TPA: hypothetical protein VF316_07005 [Polyangiaceae bacterium]